MISSARLWSLTPIALLATMLAGLATMATIAIRDPSFALERNYYEKAVHYDREIAQRAENARLGWTLDAAIGSPSVGSGTQLTLDVRDRGAHVGGAEVNVTAIRNAEASLVLEQRLQEVFPGRYATTLALRRGGHWELRFAIRRGPERFTKSLRVDVNQERP